MERYCETCEDLTPHRQQSNGPTYCCRCATRADQKRELENMTWEAKQPRVVVVEADFSEPPTFSMGARR